MELIVFAPLVVGLCALVALALSWGGAISMPRSTWLWAIGLCFLAHAQFATLLVFVLAMPLPWPPPKYSGLVIAPVAFVVAVVLVRRTARVTARRRAVVTWALRAGVTVLGLLLTVAWLVHLLEYLTRPAARYP